MKRWLIVAALVALTVGFLWQYSVSMRQADQIDAMCRKVERMQRDADYWPALIRSELLRMEMRLRAWMEARDGVEERER